MKKLFWVLVLTLFVGVAGTAAWAAEEGGERCSEQLQTCETSCAEDVVCKLRCWEDKAQCLQSVNYKEPAKQSVSFAPYSVTFTVRFF